MNEFLRPKKRHYWLYLAFPVLLYLFVAVIPVFYSAYYSLFKWSGGPKMTYIGLKNYQKLLSDATFWRSLKNNLFIVCACIVGQIGLASVFALLLNTRLARFKGLHRTLCYFPATISVVVVGFIWSLIYDYNYGMLNGFLEVIGHPEWKEPWLARPDLALVLVCIPLIWQCVGYYMVIILSALGSIDQSILEMAEIDGANERQRAFHITLPLLKPTFSVMLMLCIAGNMKAFDHVYVMTAGGPGTSTMVMALYAYNTSFLRGNMGYGNAISIGILVASTLVILLSKGAGGLLNRKGAEQ